jgi:hypothetical protein
MKLAKPRNPAKKPLALPWFLSRQDQIKLMNILRPGHQERMFTYFKLHGCVRCSQKRVLYCGNGLCQNCNQLIYRRLRVIDKQVSKAEGSPPTKQHDRFVERFKSARKMLSDFASLAEPVNDLYLSQAGIPSRIVFTPSDNNRS